MRWYSQQDLVELQRLVEESGFAAGGHGARGRLKGLLDNLAGEARTDTRRSSWGDEDVSRRPREMLRQFSRPDDPDTAFEWTPPSERRLEERRQIQERQAAPVPPPVCCSRCSQEVVFVIEDLPGGGMRQVAHCEVHGVVSLEEPEPADPNVCSSCGEHELVWALEDPQAGFQPMCPACGPVAPAKAAPPKSRLTTEETPWRHEVTFHVAAVETGRARGLTERDVVGAIRAPRRRKQDPS
jgi:hypothetical protein